MMVTRRSKRTLLLIRAKTVWEKFLTEVGEIKETVDMKERGRERERERGGEVDIEERRVGWSRTRSKGKRPGTKEAQAEADPERKNFHGQI